jgi:hypothetical protein
MTDPVILPSRFALRLTALLALSLLAISGAAAQPADILSRLVASGAAVSPDADGHYDLAALGFKTGPVTAAKPADTYRIISIGDSYAFGITVREFTYATMLQDDLSSPGRRVEVVNLGIPSVGFAEYVAIYRFWAARLQHDTVLFGVHAGTDWIDGDYSYLYKDLGDRLLTDDRILLTPKLVSTLAPKGGPKHGFDPPPATDPRYESQVQFDADSYMGILRQWGRSYRRESFGALLQGHRLAWRFLAFAANVAMGGKNVMVFVAPSPLAVSPDWRRKVFAGAGEDADPYLPGALLGRLASSVGKVPVLDLTGCFIAAAQPESSYYGTNGHWSIAGNRLAADALAGAIRRRWLSDATARSTCTDDAMTPHGGERYDWLSEIAKAGK